MQRSVSEDPFLSLHPEYGIADIPKIIREETTPPEGEPSFDPDEVRAAVSQISLPHSLTQFDSTLEHVVKVGLAHIDFTFDGDHPKYGTGAYAAPEHDGFPPTIVAAVDALTLWGFTEKAERLFEYWLHHFVRPDGTIDYYGTSLSEYGQLLTTAHRLVTRGSSESWLKRNVAPLTRIVDHVRELVKGPTLPAGVPEADENDRLATYFQNGAWLSRGLSDWSDLTDGQDRPLADALKSLTLAEIEKKWPADASDWWLTPIVEDLSGDYWDAPRDRITENRFGSYTNYRYWPELLSSGILPPDLANRVVDARLNSGGQFYGVTRFDGHLDDWPLMDFLDGLYRLGRIKEFHISLWGHILLHQAKDHFTAYEQVSMPPGRRVCDYCLPCQLVATRAAAYLVTEVKSAR